MFQLAFVEGNLWEIYTKIISVVLWPVLTSLRVQLYIMYLPKNDEQVEKNHLSLILVKKGIR